MTARQRAMIILPMCLLMFNAVQEIVEYKLPSFVPNPYTRTAVLILLFSFGFAVIGDFLVPWIVSLFDQGHKNSREKGGKTGVAVFYITAFAAIYIIYFVIYTKGVKYVLPPFWR